MKLIVDTHYFLWALFSPKKIPKRVKEIIFDADKTKYVSIITFWEISLKYQIGKLKLYGVLPDQLPEISKKSGFEILNLEVDIISSFYKLPKLKNKDPFDRLLAWQAICLDYYLLTADRSFAAYKNQGLKIV